MACASFAVWAIWVCSLARSLLRPTACWTIINKVQVLGKSFIMKEELGFIENT